MLLLKKNPLQIHGVDALKLAKSILGAEQLQQLIAKVKQACAARQEIADKAKAKAETDAEAKALRAAEAARRDEAARQEDEAAEEMMRSIDEEFAADDVAEAPVADSTAKAPDCSIEKQYKCRYCGRVKSSSSAPSDGRVRIKCLCGGQHRDNKPRVHANWTAVVNSDADARTPLHTAEDQPTQQSTSQVRVRNLGIVLEQMTTNRGFMSAIKQPIVQAWLMQMWQLASLILGAETESDVSRRQGMLLTRAGQNKWLTHEANCQKVSQLRAKELTQDAHVKVLQSFYVEWMRQFTVVPFTVTCDLSSNSDQITLIDLSHFKALVKTHCEATSYTTMSTADIMTELTRRGVQTKSELERNALLEMLRKSVGCKAVPIERDVPLLELVPTSLSSAIQGLWTLFVRFARLPSVMDSLGKADVQTVIYNVLMEGSLEHINIQSAMPSLSDDAYNLFATGMIKMAQLCSQVGSLFPLKGRQGSLKFLLLDEFAAMLKLRAVATNQDFVRVLHKPLVQTFLLLGIGAQTPSSTDLLQFATDDSVQLVAPLFKSLTKYSTQHFNLTELPVVKDAKTGAAVLFSQQQYLDKLTVEQHIKAAVPSAATSQPAADFQTASRPSPSQHQQQTAIPPIPRSWKVEHLEPLPHEPDHIKHIRLHLVNAQYSTEFRAMLATAPVQRYLMRRIRDSSASDTLKQQDLTRLDTDVFNPEANEEYRIRVVCHHIKALCMMCKVALVQYPLEFKAMPPDNFGGLPPQTLGLMSQEGWNKLLESRVAIWSKAARRMVRTHAARARLIKLSYLTHIIPLCLSFRYAIYTSTARLLFPSTSLILLLSINNLTAQCPLRTPPC